MMGAAYREHVPYRSVVILCGAIASGVAFVALLGWGLAVPALASLGKGLIPMAPSTAVLFFLYGLTVILRTRIPLRRGTLKVCVAIHGAGGLVSLTLFCMSYQGMYADIERLGFQVAIGLGSTPVGHMSPLTALCFLLAGASFLLSLSVSRDRPWRGIAALGLAATLSAAGFVLLLAYVYGSPLFYTGSFIPPAAPTSVAFAALGISLAALTAPHVSIRLPTVQGEPTKRASVVLAAIFVLFSLGIVFVGYFYTRHYAEQYRAELEQQLTAAADLKAGELMQWKRERIGGADILHKSEALKELVRRFLDTPEDAEAGEQLRTWLSQVQTAYQFDGIFLLDSHGEERLWVPEGESRVAPEIAGNAMEVLASNRVTIHDFFRHEGDGRVYLAVLVPILDDEKGDRPLGVLVMRIDPELYLYPLIQRWPTSSRTAETFLVRRDGNDAEYLNKLRFSEASALSTRDSLEHVDSLAVKAILGEDGIVEGVDYRGKRTIAAVRKVPEQPWVLVAKMDLSEVYAPAVEWLWTVVVFVGILLLGAGAGMGLLWRQQRLHFYREHYEAAEALRKSEALNRSLLEHLPHRILIKNRDSVYISCNAIYAKDLGISPEQIAGTDDFAYFPEELATSYRADDQAVMTSGTQKDIEEKYIAGGEESWIHTTKVPFSDGDGHVVGVLVIFEDITGRKRTEEALRESERFAQATLNGLTSSIAILDETGHIVTVNDAWRRFAHVNGAVLDRVCEGANYLGVCDAAMGLDSGIARDVAAAIRDIMGGRGTAFSIEYPCHSPEEKRWFLCLLTKFPGEGPSRVVIAHENITERKLAEIALRASEVRYRRLFESAKYGVMILDAKTGMVVDVNPFLVEMVGFAREQFLEKRVWELGFFKDVIPSRDSFFELRQIEYVRHDNLPLESVSGQQYVVEFVSNSYYEGKDRIIQCTVRDISKRVKADASLREAQEQLKRAVSAGNIGLWDWDLATNRVYYSPEWKRQIGYEDHEISDDFSEWQNRLHPEDLDRILHAVQAYIAEELPDYVHEFRIRHKDGSYRWILVQASLILDKAGVPVRMLGSHIDITERKRLEEQFLQAQKMESVGRLAGGVAHDFNNLLSVINGYSDFLIKKLPAADAMRADLEQIRSAGERATALTRQLLAFSRRQVLQPEVLDLNQLIAGVKKLLGRLIGEDIELAFLPDDAIVRVKVDPGQIEQVIINLAVNARDAMPRGGRLTIETKRVELDESYAEQHILLAPGAYVLLSVSDTGVGMSTETLQQVFEPFFTTKEVGKGTGLGLATVYGIVRQSGGQIQVYSEVGLGTTFKIYLPMVETEESPKHHTHRTGVTATGTESILVVEDDASLRKMTQRILQEAGYTVVSVADGKEALQTLEQDTSVVHLMLTDVVMPGMSGRELAETVLAARPGLKVLYMSGYTDDAIVHHGVVEDSMHFIGKPFNAESLTRKIRDVLDLT